MFNSTIVQSIRQLAKKWQTELALPFSAVLPAEVVVVAAALAGVQCRIRFFPSGRNFMGLSLASVGRGWHLAPSAQPGDCVLRATGRGDAFA
jgi:hypothetical protein